MDAAPEIRTIIAGTRPEGVVDARFAGAVVGPGQLKERPPSFPFIAAVFRAGRERPEWSRWGRGVMFELDGALKTCSSPGCAFRATWLAIQEAGPDSI